MFEKDLRVNGEFYVAPAYNEIIDKGACIIHYTVGSEGQGMYGLGIPADLDYFLGHPTSKRATAGKGC